MIPALLATICWSLSMIFAQRSTRILGGSEANFARLALATGMLAVWAHIWGVGLGGPSFHWFFISGIIGVGVGDVALFQTIPRLGARLTTLMVQCLTTPFAALIEYFWLDTHMTWLQIGLAGVVLAGVALALTTGKHWELSRKQLTVGLAFSVIAALGNGIGLVISRKAFADAKLAGFNVDGGSAAYQRLIGGLLLTAILLLCTKHNKLELGQSLPATEKWKKAGSWVMLNALFGQTLGVSFCQLALKYHPTVVVLPILALTPLVSIPFNHYMEKEKTTWHSIVGAIIAVGGVIGLILAQHPK